MDTDTIFKKPQPRNQSLKRESNNEEIEIKILKKVNLETEHEYIPDEDDRFYGDGLTKRERTVLDVVDDFDAKNKPNIVIDTKKLFLRLEKAINRNVELREKYKNEPLKFMDSEAELDEAIKALYVIPQDYTQLEDLIKLDCCASLISLLGHENIDIVNSVYELLIEITSEEAIEKDLSNLKKNTEIVRKLIDALVKEQLFETTTQILLKLNEQDNEEDRKGAFSIMNMLENFIAYDSQIMEKVFEKNEKMLVWFINRIQINYGEIIDREEQNFDMNSLYASELMSIAIQNSQEVGKMVFQKDGIDILLNIIYKYSARDPINKDEIEFMENIYDILCSMLQEKQHKENFLKIQGIELMLKLLKTNLMSSLRVTKVLNYALNFSKTTDLCERIIELGGLKLLFEVFMQKNFKQLKAKYKFINEKEDEEHIICVFVSMLKNLDKESVYLARFINKFYEKNMNKVDRLTELILTYNDKMTTIQKDFDQRKNKTTNDQNYFDKLHAGLFTLQMASIIMAFICQNEASIKEHVVLLLKRKSFDFSLIKSTLKEYLSSIGEDVEKVLFGRTELKTLIDNI